MRNEVKLANPNYDSSKIEEFKNVWVFCEQRQGQMMSTSYELISEGRKLADELGVKLCGLLVGDNVGDLAESIGGYGADEVIVCDHPLLKNYTTDAYSKVICDVISEMKPEAFLIGATNIGRDLGPRCAAVCTPVSAPTAPTSTLTCPSTRTSCAALPRCPRPRSTAWPPRRSWVRTTMSLAT